MLHTETVQPTQKAPGAVFSGSDTLEGVRPPNKEISDGNPD